MSTPAAEVRSFQVTIPHGTPESAPYVQDIYFPPREVVAVSWRVPPGPSGLMGWRLTMNDGIPVIPYGGGWIIADDQYNTWPLTSLPDSGYWEVTGYNTGSYDHSVYLDFQLELIAQAVATPVLTTVPGGGGTTPATTPAGATVPVTAPASTPGGGTVPAGYGTIPVSAPAGVTVPAGYSIPPPATVAPVSVPVISTPAVSVPPPVSIPPVSVPPVSVPPPVTVKQPVFTAPKVPVPDATGKTASDGYQVLHQAGFAVTFTPARKAGVTYDVLAQKPAAGSSAPFGSTVQLTVNPAADTAAVPDVTGQRSSPAETTLKKAGFAVTFSMTRAKGVSYLVAAQSPGPRKLAAKGSTVHLTIAVTR